MTRRPPLPLLVLALLAPLFALLNAAFAAPAEACGPGVEAEVVDGLVLCTHGNDEAPPGVDTTELPSTEALLEARFGVDTKAEVQEVAAEGAEEPSVAAAGSVACIGDGVSGARVQLVYAHASNVANRYSSVLPLLRQYAADADDMINVSAGQVGGGRRIRYVTNASCLPEVLNVTLSGTGDDSFGNMVTELRNMGMTSNDRKYLAFVDAAVGICGLGEVYLNDRGDELNPNNSGRPQYARVDTGCWQHAAAHELIHTLGGVQNTAPNSSGAGHCTDENDVMCYKDTSTTVTRQVCTLSEQVDCNNNDYFHPNPQANSYLATKWNVARSRYLSADEAPPAPPVTTVTVPATGVSGSPWPVSANVATTGAGIVWSSTRSDCWFGDPHAAATSWTCPATAQGAGQITVHVTENSITKAYTTPVSLVVPATKLTPSVSMRASATSIYSGQSVTLTGRVLSMATGAAVPGLPVRFQAKPRNTKTWSDVTTVVTSRTGSVSATVTPQRHTAYRMVTNFNHTWAMAYTAAVDVSVSTKLTTALNSKLVSSYSTTSVGHQTVKLRAQVSPDKAGDVIKLKRYTKGQWRLISEKRLNENSSYTFFYKPLVSGKHHLKVVKPGDFTNRVSRKFITLRVG